MVLLLPEVGEGAAVEELAEGASSHTEGMLPKI